MESRVIHKPQPIWDNIQSDASLTPTQRLAALAFAALIVKSGICTGNAYDDATPDNATVDTRMFRAIYDDFQFILTYLAAEHGLKRSLRYTHIDGQPKLSSSYRYSFLHIDCVTPRSCFVTDPVWMLLEKAEAARRIIASSCRPESSFQLFFDLSDAAAWEQEQAKHLHIVRDPSWTALEKAKADQFNNAGFTVRDLHQKNGRCYTSLTQMSKRLRANVRFGSDRLASIDITSAFPTFACILTGHMDALDDIVHLKPMIREFFVKHDMPTDQDALTEFRQRMIMDSLTGLKTKFYTFIKRRGMGKFVAMLKDFHDRCRTEAKAQRRKTAQIIEETLGKVEAYLMDSLFTWAIKHNVVLFRIHDAVLCLESDIESVYNHVMAMGQVAFGVDLGLESPLHGKTYPTVAKTSHRLKDFMLPYKNSLSLSRYVGEWFLHASLIVLARYQKRREIIQSRYRHRVAA